MLFFFFFFFFFFFLLFLPFQAPGRQCLSLYRPFAPTNLIKTCTHTHTHTIMYIHTYTNLTYALMFRTRRPTRVLVDTRAHRTGTLRRCRQCREPSALRTCGPMAGSGTGPRVRGSPGPRPAASWAGAPGTGSLPRDFGAAPRSTPSLRESRGASRTTSPGASATMSCGHPRSGTSRWAARLLLLPLLHLHLRRRRLHHRLLRHRQHRRASGPLLPPQRPLRTRCPRTHQSGHRRGQRQSRPSRTAAAVAAAAAAAAASSRSEPARRGRGRQARRSAGKIARSARTTTAHRGRSRRRATTRAARSCVRLVTPSSRPGLPCQSCADPLTRAGPQSLGDLGGGGQGEEGFWFWSPWRIFFFFFFFYFLHPQPPTHP
jgi:hypothetical protein